LMTHGHFPFDVKKDGIMNADRVGASLGMSH
jgi:hypothetical protein